MIVCFSVLTRYLSAIKPHQYMSLVEKYVRKLLYEHDCVVLPELGGFIVHANHAFFSEQHNLYHAPHRRVAFNEALKLDDGLLVHYLTLNEPMSREEAQKQLRQYTEQIKQSIKTGGSYALAEIGTLSANEEGKYVFEPQPMVNFLPEAYGFTSIAAQSTQPSLQLLSDSAADWTYTDRSPESLPFALPRRRRSRAAWYAATALLIGALVLGSNVQLTPSSLKSSLNPFDLMDRFSIDKKSNDVKVFDNQPVVNNTASVVVAPPITPQPIVLAEKAMVAPAPAPEIVSKPIKKTTVVKPEIQRGVSSDENAQYWVIACGFMQRTNAEKLVNKLKNSGYDQAHLFNPDATEGTLIKVAAVGFETKSKANKYLRTVSKISGAQAWVLQK